MKYRALPGTGVSVSNLALGTMGFGTETDEADAFAILDRFVEANGNLIDTSNVYGGGASEELVGRWFASRPADITERVVLATKARFGTGPDVNEAGSSRRNLDRALSASLRRLGRDKVDLYQLHGWDPLTPIEETLGFLDDAVHASKINYIGLSNFTGWQLQLTLCTAKAMGVQVPVTLQQQYSLVSREIEYEKRAGRPAQQHRPAAVVSSGGRVPQRRIPQRRKGRKQHPGRRRQPDERPHLRRTRRQGPELGHPGRRPRHRSEQRSHAQPGGLQLGHEPAPPSRRRSSARKPSNSSNRTSSQVTSS
jgi:aryl-alcohol dehydrogenase-like predicted oxidoreductase